MGLNFSTTYEQCVQFIENNDIEGFKKHINSIDREVVRQNCLQSCPDDELNRSLLHHAVWRDDSIILQTLMPYCEGDSLEIYDAYGMTPLAASINRGNFEAVKMLLEHSSQINCDQLGGYVLLRSAVYKNSTEIVNLLLQYNCETRNEELDTERGSLLHVATDMGNLDVVKFLVDRSKLDVNIEDRWKITPIHVAAAKNRLDILKYLIDKDANMDIEDIFGNTPLGWAVFYKSDDCTIYLRSLNAKVKEFVVPPPPEEYIEASTSSAAAAKHDKQMDLSDITLVQKTTEGSFNPTFELNEERKETTIV